MINLLLRYKKQYQKPAIRDTSLLAQLKKLLAMLFVILILHTFAMMGFEKLSFADALWLTMTSATTVGYGDLSARSLEGRISTIVLLYVAGIFILAQVAAMYFEYRQEIRNRILKGDWSWNMDNHIVFLNCPGQMGEEYFYQAISQLRSSDMEFARAAPIIIVTTAFGEGLPDKLRQLDVIHVAKPITDNETLVAASVAKAHTLVVLASNQLDPATDSINFDLISRIREMGAEGRIIAEVVRDVNRNRLIKAGANNVLRPIRAYPELLARTILAPGAEQVIETLFNSHGEECIRYDMQFELPWLEVVQRLAQADLGLPVAYENTAGEIINTPSTKETVKAQALFIIARENEIRSDAELKAALGTS